jgi:hypothetical protein
MREVEGGETARAHASSLSLAANNMRSLLLASLLATAAGHKVVPEVELLR